MQRLIHPTLLFTLLSLSLTGCARFEDRPLNPVDSAARIEARALSSVGLRDYIDSVLANKTGQPPKAWDIDRLTLAAIYYHPDLALARAQAETMDAAITTAGQRPNPNITLSPTWVTNIAMVAAPWIIGSSISIPIETAGKRGFRLDKTQHLTDAARLRITDAAWLVRGRLRLAMLEVYAAQEAERLLQQQLVIQQAMTERLEQQLSIGEITRLEVMRSHLALNQMQLNVSAARKRNAESRVLLATAVGVPVDALAGIEFDFSKFVQPTDLRFIPVTKLRETALQKRPDVLAALADYAAAQSALQLEIANQYPNIQANPGYTFDLGANYWTLGATALQLPILHQNQGPIAEAEAKRRELAVRFEALQMRILGDIDRTHAGLGAVLAKWADAEKQMRLQQENLQSAQALFQAGETDPLALLGAKLERAAAERARLDMLVEAQQALNALEDTLRYPIASTLTATLISDSAIRKTPQ
ncbi:TolC family protein [Methylobacter tundripaludum]|uniref:Outer membrane efflux protein n=1 Tax=Methylobacter tundripaludum (strain ATCC BAA-1195 / DSM 17260 / SV96) TaxID=697282 RepID=G3ITT4_METTV|nr:TolC family protein [Methylobacter tundripaludum]EGW22605.1 outer membrane efflux protein [Methylobacter tundripaludum SV96]